MEVRIEFKSVIYLKGDSLKEIAQKWDKMELFSDEANNAEACQIELNGVEDEDFNDITDEFNKYY